MFTVLLVEDDVAVRQVLGRQLRLEGLEVFEAETGDEALCIAMDRLYFDVAVLDCVLPGKLDGQDLVKELRKLCPDIGIIRISGYYLDGDDISLKNEHDVFLSKPIKRTELIDSVHYAYQVHVIKASESLSCQLSV